MARHARGKASQLERMVTSTSTPGSREMEVYAIRHRVTCGLVSGLVSVRGVCYCAVAAAIQSSQRGQTYDLLHNLRGGVQVDEPLVDPHLVVVPSLGSLTTGRLSGGMVEDLGGETDRSLDSELLVLGSRDEVVADFLEVLDATRGESDADPMNLGRSACGGVNLLGVLGDVTHGWHDEVRR